jgi:hypothetical protein
MSPCLLKCPVKVSDIFFGAMRIDAFRTAEQFKADMDKWIERFRSAEPIDGNERY